MIGYIYIIKIWFYGFFVEHLCILIHLKRDWRGVCPCMIHEYLRHSHLQWTSVYIVFVQSIELCPKTPCHEKTKTMKLRLLIMPTTRSIFYDKKRIDIYSYIKSHVPITKPMRDCSFLYWFRFWRASKFIKCCFLSC